MRIIVEHLWDEADRGKPKYSKKNLSHCHFATNLTWTELESNASLRGERLLTTIWSHGAASKA
jgi:hypothetical protein